MEKKYFKNKKGFTIIEVMVTIAVFTILISIGISSLLAANVHWKKNHKLSSIMDSLTFIIDDMSTNMRTGTNFVCGEEDEGDPMSPDCPTGSHFISFLNNNDNTGGTTGVSWKYYFTAGADGYGDLKKTTDGNIHGEAIYNLNPEEIRFDANSGFKVVGAYPNKDLDPNNDNLQPYIVINLSGYIFYKEEKIPFAIQTAISQRLVDIQ